MWSEFDNEFVTEYTPLTDHPMTVNGRARMLYSRLSIRWLLILLALGFFAAVLLAGNEDPYSSKSDAAISNRSDTTMKELNNAKDNMTVSNNTEKSQIEILNAVPILQMTHNFNSSQKTKFGSNRKNIKGQRNSIDNENSIPVDNSNSLNNKTSNPTMIPTFSNGTFKFEGSSSAALKASSFGNIVPDKSMIIKVELVNVTIDAAVLSSDLQGCKNLKSIVLSNVYIIGEFDRVVLPALEIFILQQLPQPGETKEDYQDEAKLKSRIFFDKNETWDLKNDIANLGCKIQFSIDGVTLLKISQTTEEMVLYVPFCDSILKSVSWTLSTLTLVKCNISAASIPINLIYFNVYKVNILNGGNFTQIIQTFTRLTDFYAQIPDETLNLSDFPSSLSTLTVIDTELDFREPYHSGIKNLAIGYHLGDKLLQSMDMIMPTLDRVAVFGIPDEMDASIILQKLLLNTTAQWIVMEEFKRNPNSNFPSQQWVEQYLTEIGIPESATNFLITQSKNSTELNRGNVTTSKNGRLLTLYEFDYYHYILLGWYKSTTFEAYQKIQQRKLATLKIK